MVIWGLKILIVLSITLEVNSQLEDQAPFDGRSPRIPRERVRLRSLDRVPQKLWTLLQISTARTLALATGR